MRTLLEGSRDVFHLSKHFSKITPGKKGHRWLGTMTLGSTGDGEQVRSLGRAAGSGESMGQGLPWFRVESRSMILGGATSGLPRS